MIAVCALLLATVADRVLVTAFGAIPNSKEDATEAITRAIAAAKDGSTIEFPAGDYHFHREHGQERTLFLSNSDVVNPRKIAILIENRKRLRLLGHRARLIFHDRVMPLAILGSEGITVEGFTVDWQRPLMSQGTVLAYDEKGMTLALNRSEYPYVVEDGKLWFTDSTWKRQPWGCMEFDAASKGIAYQTGDAGITDGNWRQAKVSEPEAGQVRFDFPSRRGPTVGNVLAFRHGSRDHAGAFIQDSKNITLSHVAFRHTSGLGVLAQYTENLTFKNVDVAPDPRGTRVFAGHDDGFHFSNCKGHIAIEGCNFEGLMDDPINVHGTSVRVLAKLSDTTLRCGFMHDQSIGLRFGDPGDTVSLLDHETLLSRGTLPIKSLKRLSAQEFEITFRNPIPASLNVNDALENLTWTPSFTVKKSVFGRVRARGLLVSTPKKVVIEECLFRSSGAAILIAGDANGWYESGAVTNVSIRGNTFDNCNTSTYQFGDAVISINPEIPNLSLPFHRNIRIEDNAFLTFDLPVLWAKSVKGLNFRGNSITRSQQFQPWHPNKAGLTFVGCEDVQVEGNELDRNYRGRTTKVEGGKPETIKITGWP